MDETDSLNNIDEKNDDWPSKASQLVVDQVDSIRNKTTGPALIASRYVVYLAAIALIGIIALIIGFILLVRLLVVATGELSFVNDGETWLAYFIIGSIFLLIGAFLWRKKEPKKENNVE